MIFPIGLFEITAAAWRLLPELPLTFVLPLAGYGIVVLLVLMLLLEPAPKSEPDKDVDTDEEEK